MLDFIFIAVSDGWNEVTETIAGWHKPLLILGRDIQLFASLCLARLIVWHEMRGQH
ncbi:MAG: hypothetical protein WBP93_11655 [Pyrinomonadaceae bacterium]